MRLNLHVTTKNPVHTRAVLFIDGANCGELCVFTKDIGQLVDIIRTGCDAYDGEMQFITNHVPDELS